MGIHLRTQATVVMGTTEPEVAAGGQNWIPCLASQTDERAPL